jgi:hypothetical protein
MAHVRREARSGLGDRGGCVAVKDLNVFGRFGAFRFPLQFPLSLMIQLLIPALWFSTFLPKFIRAANNIHSAGFFHCVDFLPLSPCKDCKLLRRSIRLLRPRVVRWSPFDYDFGFRLSTARLTSPATRTASMSAPMMYSVFMRWVNLKCERRTCSAHLHDRQQVPNLQSGAHDALLRHMNSRWIG